MKVSWRITHLSFLFLFFFSHLLLGEGFIAGTLVKTPNGHVPIERLLPGDKIICHDVRSNRPAESVITHVHQKITRQPLQLMAGTTELLAHRDQKFYVPNEQKWYKAQTLKAGQSFLKNHDEPVALTHTLISQQPSRIYALSVGGHRNYLVSNQNIVAHNTPALMAVPAIAKGSSLFAASLTLNPLVAPITIAVGGAGLAIYVIWTIVDGIKKNIGESAPVLCDAIDAVDGYIARAEAAEKEPQEKNSADTKSKDADKKKKEKASVEKEKKEKRRKGEEDKKKKESKPKTPEELLKETKPGKERKAKQFIKEGGYQEALKDFESLDPTNVKDMPSPKVGKVGTLPDGRTVNVREQSTEGSPTLEIQPLDDSSDKEIKIRYVSK